jgi:flagellar biosynthesis protein FlhB
MSDPSDRVIPATPRRREAARRQGGMPTAALPAWVATAGTAVLLLPAWAATTMPAAAEMLRGTISGAARAARHGDVALPAVIAVVVPTVALVLAAAAAGIGVRILLDGFSWQPARALPMLRRIDPLAGLARIFSFRTLTTAVGAGIGLAALAAAAAWSLRPLLATTATMAGISESTLVAAVAWRSAAWLFAAAAIVAGCRWALARRRFERQICMTPQEFAEEARSAQADPKIKLLQRQRPRQPTAGTA